MTVRPVVGAVGVVAGTVTVVVLAGSVTVRVGAATVVVWVTVVVGTVVVCPTVSDWLVTVGLVVRRAAATRYEHDDECHDRDAEGGDAEDRGPVGTAVFAGRRFAAGAAGRRRTAGGPAGGPAAARRRVVVGRWPAGRLLVSRVQARHSIFAGSHDNRGGHDEHATRRFVREDALRAAQRRGHEASSERAPGLTDPNQIRSQHERQTHLRLRGRLFGPRGCVRRLRHAAGGARGQARGHL